MTMPTASPSRCFAWWLISFPRFGLPPPPAPWTASAAWASIAIMRRPWPGFAAMPPRLSARRWQRRSWPRRRPTGEARWPRWRRGITPQAILTAQTAHNHLRQAYFLSLKPVTPEFRAFWEGDAPGPFPGNWAAAVNALVTNGFTAVFPNMLCGGLAHYNSAVPAALIRIH